MATDTSALTVTDPPPAASGGGNRAYWSYRAAETLVHWLPRRLTYSLAGGGGAVYARLRPHRFEGLRANLRHVRPDADATTLERLVRRNVRNVARCWVDVMEMRYRPRRVARRLEIETGLHHYTDALERGHGAVVVSMHFGNWETGLAAWNGAGGQLALLAEEVRPKKLFDRLVSARSALGVRVIPLDAAAMRTGSSETARRVGAQAMREVLKHLKAGNTIAIAMDRDITGGGRMLDFFGTPAPIPVGTVDVAMRAGAAIVPVALIRAGERVEARVFPEVAYDISRDRDAEVRRVAEHILRIFEELIRDHPEMWHVLEPIWPADKVAPAAAL